MAPEVKSEVADTPANSTVENTNQNPESQDIAGQKDNLQKLQELQKQLEEDLTLSGIRKETRVLKREIKKLWKTWEAIEKQNKVLFNKALLTLDLEDRKNFNKYLKDVIDKKIDPATEKFKPQNLEAFVSMLQQMPYLAWYIDFWNYDTSKWWKSQGKWVEMPVYTVVAGNNTSNQRIWKKIDTSDDETLWEAYKEHGLRGLIKKSFDYSPNMTENQKDLRTNALFLWWVWFALFKLGKRFFTWAKDKEGKAVWPWFRWRLAILWWVTLWSNVLTGKSPIELIDKALNGWMSREYLKWERWKWADEAKKIDKQEYVYPLVASTVFWKTKISDLWNLLNDNFKIKDYDILLQKAKEEWNQEVVDMLNRIWKTDTENQIKQWLEKFWIKKDNLTTFWEKTVDDLREIYEANLLKAKLYIQDKKLIQSEDPEKIKEYNDLISSWKEITDDDLKKLVETGVLYEQFEIKKDSNREALKNKIDKLEDGKSLKIKIGDDDAELSKINWISEVELKSKNGNITKINLGVDWPSIIWLWDWADRPFVDKNDNPDIYSTILYAHKFNWLKNRYKNRKVAAWDEPFKFENWKIYFNESKTWTTEINKVEVMDDGIILWLMTDFPDVFKWQEQQIVKYLNKEIILQNQSLEDVIKEFNNKNIQIKLEWDELMSHWESTAIDVDNKKIIWLDDTDGTWPNRQFKNYSDLVWWANLINFFKSFLRDRQAQSKDPIYIWADLDIAFNDRTLFEEMKSYANRGANWFWDSDLIQSGELFFRKADSLKKVSPTLYAHRKEFVQYLNNTEDLFKEYVPEDREAKKLAEIKKKISETLNDWIEPTIDFGEDSMEYDKEQKKLIIKGIDEKKIQNDKLVENLWKLNNLVSRYDLFDSEYVNKIELPNIDLKPGETISIKYLKKLLDFNPNKIQLWPDMLANKEMIKYVIEKKYSEWRFTIEENTNLDMNGIVILKYIYENGYDFDRLFDWEDDSRLDFTMRVMQLLSEGQTIIDPDHKKELLKIKWAPITLKPNHDPILERRRMSIKEDINYAKDLRWIKNWFYTARNDNILEKIAKYYNENYPNIADTNP